MSETFSLPVTRGNLYDYPEYYDLIFGNDWRAEFHFLKACFAKYAERPVQRLFEPACGTGRLLFRFAKAGYEVRGLDLNERAVEYCNERLARGACQPEAAWVGDMTDFRLRPRADAAFNTINSFRHLATEQLAAAHLACMAEALQPGGLYLLGLHLTPTVGPAMDEESWSARRGHLQVNSRLWTKKADRRTRRETLGMTFDVYTPTRQFRLEDEVTFRMYTADQMAALLAAERQFEIVATHDFAYKIHRPIEIGPTTEDVVYVLRKRK